MKLKEILKHSKTRQPDKPNPLLIFVFHLRWVYVRWGSCTKQNGEWSHHTAAQGEDDPALSAGAFRDSDGDVDVEHIENPGRTKKRGQSWEEGREPAFQTACTQAAASSPIWSLLCCSVCLTSWAPHSQFNTLWWRAYEGPNLIYSTVQSVGFWTPSGWVSAVGDVSLGGWRLRASAVFNSGFQTDHCEDWTGTPLIRLPFFWLMSSRVPRVSVLLVALQSWTCSKRSTVLEQQHWSPDYQTIMNS